jgi:thioesterase domain-containing protein
VLDALLAALKDPNWLVRQGAAKALGQLGQTDAKVLDALLAALKDPDSDVRQGAAQALGQLGQPDAKVLDALLAALKDPVSSVRQGGAQALGQLGQPDAKVVDALLAALKDPDSSVRQKAAQALVQLGQASTFKVLLKGPLKLLPAPTQGPLASPTAIHETPNITLSDKPASFFYDNNSHTGFIKPSKEEAIDKEENKNEIPTRHIHALESVDPGLDQAITLSLQLQKKPPENGEENHRLSPGW